MVIKYFFKIFLLLVCARFSLNYSGSKEWFVDLGSNITLPCDEKLSNNTSGGSALWIKSGREEEQINRLKILPNGSLSLERVVRSDTGEYKCRFETDKSETEEISGRELVENNDEIRTRYKLIVRTPPPILANVTVHPSTVLALLLWDINDTGGYDISYFSARYRLKHDPLDIWHNVVPIHISPTARQIDIYHLVPNSTYTFQIWAVNALGIGEATQIDATTNHILEEIELARHLLKGAENFDTRIWVVAVAVVMGTLIMLSAGTCYILCRECNFFQFSDDDEEVMELVPNIILNPVFYETEYEKERLNQLDDNCNNSTIRFHKNTLIQPV